MKKKLIASSIITICTVLIIVGVTLADFTSQDSVTNVINTGSINAVPEEEVHDTTKKVWIKNTGDNECFVRVSITPRWVDQEGNPWAGDVNMVRLGFSDNLIEISESNTWPADKWVKYDDGYYYYTSKLPVGESTSELLSTVTLNDGILDEYKSKTLKVDIKVEAVQTTQNAYRTVWSIIEDSKIDELFNSLISQTKS